jgi:hypothetical protein
MTNAAILVAALRNPQSVAALDACGWTALLTIARAEQLIGTLAHRLRGMDMPGQIAAMLEDAHMNAEYQRRTALWEADCARRALAGYAGKTVLMKGTAYVAAGLVAGEGRHIGDLDIMAAREDLGEVEDLLLGVGGWEWVKENAYDDAYYRDHMHELPPMIHKERDRMIDVHHTILPLTARPKPDPAAMLRDAAPLPLAGGVRGGASEVSGCQSGPRQSDPRQSDPPPAPPTSGRGDLFVFSPADMVVHCAAHLFADGDLTGGLRNLWDMHCLVGEFSEKDENFWPKLQARAIQHELRGAVHLAARLARDLYGSDIPPGWQIRGNADSFFIRRLLARDEWGRGTAKFTRLTFYIRSHWLRMPPLMLMRHLWTKWRKA